MGGLVQLPRFEQIMERFQRLERYACLMLRANFPPGPSRWYLSLGPVSLISLDRGGWSDLVHGWSGETPEQAVLNSWEAMLADMRRGAIYRHHTCPRDVPIPGDGPQVWVRWDQAIGDWQDVEPTERALQAHRIPRDRVIPYARHRIRQQDP